jgi:hypothetical protein
LEFAKIFNFEIADFGLSGVNDNAQATTLLHNFANFEAIFENALTRESGAQMGLFDEKNQRSKIS